MSNQVFEERPFSALSRRLSMLGGYQNLGSWIAATHGQAEPYVVISSTINNSLFYGWREATRRRPPVLLSGVAY